MAMESPLPLRLQVPEGVKDRLPREAAGMRALASALIETFRRWGYREVMTPVFEFLDTALAGQGNLARREDYYQLFDRRGRTLALRPDMTAPIARLSTTKLAGEPRPLRLCYWGAVFRHRERKSGALHEVWQAGTELVGAAGAAADAEVVALACGALASTGLQEFQIGLGHVQFIEGVLAAAGVDDGAADELRDALAHRDLVAFEKVAQAAAPDPDAAQLLLDLALFQGDISDARERFGHLQSPRVHQALAELTETLALLDACGVRDQVALDLGLARALGYYTGLIFEAYAPGVGAPVLGGGRYDNLMVDFDADAVPATGFAVDADRVIQALERQGRAPAEPGLDVLLVPAPGNVAAAVARATELRSQGLAVEVELTGRNGADVEAYARARGAARVEQVMGDPGPVAPPGDGTAGPADGGRPGPEITPIH